MDAHRSAAASSVYVLAALAASGLIALGACGGSASSVDGTGTSGGGGGGDGALISMICPTVLPATGSACLGATTPGNSCEYGGEGAFLSCTTVAVCGADRTWTVNTPDASCSGTAAKNEAACPSSYATLAAGAACPATLAGTCVYPEGVCECAHCSSPGASPGAERR